VLDVCEIGVAVAWGSAALAQVADVVITGHGPAGRRPREALDGHLRHHDFSPLDPRRVWRSDPGDGARPLKGAYAQGRRLDVNDALAQRIRERYTTRQRAGPGGLGVTRRI